MVAHIALTAHGKADETELPPELEALLKTLPPNLTRRQGAKVVSDNLFPLSHRTLEGNSWPLPTRHVNGYVVVPTRALVQEAYRRFAAAPVVMSGRRAAQNQHAE